ncbi:MAG: type II toxin-antitoxin system HicB family antitoxin [Phycisphaerales bacterium]
MATEILFVVEEDPTGGLVASAVGQAIVTQAETPEELREAVRDAVKCHFEDEAARPRLIRLHHVRDETLS